MTKSFLWLKSVIFVLVVVWLRLVSGTQQTIFYPTEQPVNVLDEILNTLTSALFSPSSTGSTIVGALYPNLVKSTDYGATWSKIPNAPTLLTEVSALATSANGQFIAIADFLSVYTSQNGGNSWATSTPVTGLLSLYHWTRLVCSDTGATVLAAATTGAVYRSNNSGTSWTAVPVSAITNGVISSIGMSGNGKYLVITLESTTSLVYISSNYGSTWTTVPTTQLPKGCYENVVISDSGADMALTPCGSTNFYRSHDYGSTWQTTAPALAYVSVAVSSTGQYVIASSQYATGAASKVLVSSDYGNYWTTVLTGSGTKSFNNVVASATGQIMLAAAAVNGWIMYSHDHGSTWHNAGSNNGQYVGYTVNGLSLSGLGVYAYVCVPGVGVMVSVNYGTNWTLSHPSALSWNSVGTSSTGLVALAAATTTGSLVSGNVVLTTNGGSTWNTVPVPSGLRVCVAVDTSGIVLAVAASNSTASVLYLSINGGTSWNIVSTPSTHASPLLWATVSLSGDGSNLFLTDTAGHVYNSTNHGNTWQLMIKLTVAGSTVRVGVSSDASLVVATPGGSQSALHIFTPAMGWGQSYGDSSILSVSMAGGNPSVMVAGGAAHVYISNSYGAFWYPASGLVGSNWGSVGSDKAGDNLLAFSLSALEYFTTYITSAVGLTQSPTMAPVPTVKPTTAPAAGSLPLTFYEGTALPDLTGNVLVAASALGDVVLLVGTDVMYRSTDFGANWVNLSMVDSTASQGFSALSDDSLLQGPFNVMSMNGTGEQIALLGTYLYISVDMGNTWRQVSNINGISFADVAVSVNGVIMLAVQDGGKVYISRDSGDTFVAASAPLNVASVTWRAAAVSSNGKYMLVANNDLLNTLLGMSPAYYSVDFGNTWTGISASLLPIASFYDAFVSSDGSVMYLVGDMGLYKSTDHGATWNEVTSTFSALLDLSLLGYTLFAAAPKSPQLSVAVFGGSSIGISGDGGNTWYTPTMVNSDDTLSVLSNTWSSIVTTAEGSIVYAFDVTSKVLYSTYPAITVPVPLTFYEGPSFPQFGNSDVLVATSVAGDTVVVAGNTGGVYVSVNFGGTWSGANMTHGPQGPFTVMAVNGTGQMIALLGVKLYLTTDLGSTWRTVTAPNSLAFVDVALCVSGLVLLAVQSNGLVYISRDSGHTFTPAPSPLNQAMTWTTASLSSNGRYMLVANNDLLNIVLGASPAYYSTDYGNTWNAISGSMVPISVFVDSFVSSTGQYMYLIGQGGLYQSSDYGSTWNYVTSSYSSLLDLSLVGYSLFAAATRNPMVSIAAFGDDTLTVSVDGGVYWYVPTIVNSDDSLLSSVSSWSSLAATADGIVIYAYDTLSNVLYSTSEAITYYSPNHAPTASPTPTMYKGPHLHNLADSSTVLVATSLLGDTVMMVGDADAYISVNYGANFVSLDISALDGPFSVVSMNGTGSTIALLGVHLYLSGDQGNSWTQIAEPNSLPFVDVKVCVSGVVVVAVQANGHVYISRDSGSNFSPAPHPMNATGVAWRAVGLSASGRYMLVGNDVSLDVSAGTAPAYYSNDFGYTWNAVPTASLPINLCVSVSVSSSGQHMYVAGDVGLYKSSNYGKTWSLVVSVSTDIPELSVLGYSLFKSAPDSPSVSVALFGPDTLGVSLNGGKTWSVPTLINHLTDDDNNGGNDDDDDDDDNSSDDDLVSALENSWKAVAVSAAGAVIYAFDSTKNVLYSTNSAILTPLPMIMYQGPTLADLSGDVMLAASLNGDVVVAVGDTKVYVSTTYGSNWNSVDLTNGPTGPFTAVSVNGTGEQIALLGLHLYISSDSGSTWSQVSNPNNLAFVDVAVCISGVIMLAVQNGGKVYISKNSGHSFHPAPNPVNATNAPWSVAALSASGKFMLVGNDYTVASGLSPAYYSHDSGNTWHGISHSVLPVTVFLCASVSSNGQHMYLVAEVGVYQSTDYGVTWSYVVSASTNILSLSSLSYSLFSAAPQSPLMTVSVVGNTLAVSGNGGSNWFAPTIRNNGDDDDISISVSIADTSSTVVNLWTSLVATASGKVVYAFDSANNVIYSSFVGVSTPLPLTFYQGPSFPEATGAVLLRTNAAGDVVIVALGDVVYLSTDYASNWAPLDTTVAVGPFTTMSTNGTGGTIALLGANLYISVDMGNTWTTIPNMNNLAFVDVAVCVSGVVMLAVQDGGYIYVSRDSGSNFAPVPYPMNAVPASWSVVALSGNGQYMLAGNNNNGLVVSVNPIYYSTDAGLTWTGVSSSVLPITICIDAFVSSTGEHMYVTTDVGLYQSSNYGKSWKLVVSVSTNILQLSDFSITAFAAASNSPLLGVSVLDSNTLAVTSNGGQNLFASVVVNTDDEVPALTNVWVAATVSLDGTVAYVYDSANNIIYGSNSIITSRLPTAAPTNMPGALMRLYKAEELGTSFVKALLATSGNGQVIVAATVGSDLVAVSRDYGHTWTMIDNFDSSSAFLSVSVDSTGATIVLGTTLCIYVSTDYGNTFVKASVNVLSGDWTNVRVSMNGQYVVATLSLGGLYISSDHGQTFALVSSSILPASVFTSVSVSSDGRVIVCTTLGTVYTSKDHGVSFTSGSGVNTLSTFIAQVSAAGDYVAVMDTVNNVLHVSADVGSTFTKQTTRLQGLAMLSVPLVTQYVVAPSNPARQMMVVTTDLLDTVLYVSADFGKHWSVPSINVTVTVSAKSSDAGAEVAAISHSNLRRHGPEVDTSVDDIVTDLLDFLWSSVATDANGTNIVAFDHLSHAIFTSNSSTAQDVAPTPSPTARPSGGGGGGDDGPSKAVLFGSIFGSLAGAAVIGGGIYYVAVVAPAASAGVASVGAAGGGAASAGAGATFSLAESAV